MPGEGSQLVTYRLRRTTWTSITSEYDQLTTAITLGKLACSGYDAVGHVSVAARGPETSRDRNSLDFFSSLLCL